MAVSQVEPSIYVGGQWRQASGDHIDVFDPRDGSVIASVPGADTDEVGAALLAAAPLNPVGGPLPRPNGDCSVTLRSRPPTITTAPEQVPPRTTTSSTPRRHLDAPHGPAGLAGRQSTSHFNTIRRTLVRTQ
jgi:hypothetical protein